MSFVSFGKRHLTYGGGTTSLCFYCRTVPPSLTTVTLGSPLQFWAGLGWAGLCRARHKSSCLWDDQLPLTSVQAGWTAECQLRKGQLDHVGPDVFPGLGLR